MKRNHYLLIAIVLLMFSGCNSSIKVLSAWKSKDIDKMKDRNILVIARTSDIEVRADFESSIANKLRSAGYKATESFTRFPKMDHDEEMTEEQRKRILDIFGYEGYDAICISVLKDYSETKTTNYYNDYYGGGMGMMGPYTSYYPSYYGGFNTYYAHPYSYSTFGDYYGSDVSYTTIDKKYVLETLFYNLNNEDDEQLMAATTTVIENPKDAVKTAEKYTEKIAESLSKLDK
jgi:hypothetical protein|tara:strand:- start:380 stop:1075 length:696 start_codon:yes stop_codon:yes gene_type:complete